MKVFRRLLGFLAPHRGAVTAAFVMSWGTMLATVAIPYMTGRAIDAVRDHSRHQLTTWVVLIAAAGVVRLFFSVGRRLIAGRLSLGVEFDLRNRLYGQLQRLELSFFDRQQTGQLMSRATVDLQSVRFFLGYGLVFIAQSILTIALAGAAMFALQPALAALSLLPVPFVVVMASRFGRKSRPALQEVQQQIAELTAEVQENIAGVRVVKAFAREPFQLERFRVAVERLFRQSVYANRIQARFAPTISFLPSLGLAVVLLVGGREVIEHELTLGDFTAFYAYLLMLISPMSTLGTMLASAQRATASGARIFEILDREPEMTVPDGAPPLPDGPGRVQLRGVTLRFEGANHPALRDLDLDIAPGQTVAIVGAMGSGKTALASLLPRLYDVSAGRVMIDAADVRTVELASLRSAIAVTSDDPFLFSATIHENIAYARPEASRDDVQRAAQAAQAQEFIAALPDGYDTLVGERGLTLSGGQRQRLAIARAILANPRILILDDATSSVDAATEGAIKAALGDVLADRTTLIVAHRLSTIALADEIVVLENGRVADRGTFDELIERSEVLREIADLSAPGPAALPVVAAGGQL
jgi:ABC-type multidrug transport system fused ATPase/permease subunit